MSRKINMFLCFSLSIVIFHCFPLVFHSDAEQLSLFCGARFPYTRNQRKPHKNIEKCYCSVFLVISHYFFSFFQSDAERHTSSPMVQTTRVKSTTESRLSITWPHCACLCGTKNKTIKFPMGNPVRDSVDHPTV